MEDNRAAAIELTAPSDNMTPNTSAVQTRKKCSLKVDCVIDDRYKLLAEVGYGGMGMVFRALDTQTGDLKAVKVMHNHLQDNETNIKRFEREAEVALDLDHENIISVCRFGLTEKHEPFIIMEFLKGESLDELIQHSGVVPVDLFYHLFLQICRGLSYSHSKGVVHRDIKPSNIMIVDGDDGTELVKIVDFGIARVCSKTGVVCPTTSNMLKALCKTSAGLTDEQKDELQRLTQPGEIFGSPLYMSPEQCQGEEADCRSEVYSLGCMMFEALTGKPPLKGTNAMDTLILRINEDAPLINTVDPELKFPEALEKVVAKALARYPNQRYQEVHELTAALEEAMAS